MASSSSIIDWETLKPKILCLLSEGKTRKDVIEELSSDGSRITKSQLEYQLKRWGRRTNLSEQAWRYTNHKVQKRARNKKISAVFFNGALIPHDKVVKEIRRHDRPTLFPTTGDSPRCPEGFDLMVCTPPSSAQSPFRNASPDVQHSILSPTRTIATLPWLKFMRELRSSFVLTSMGSKISIVPLANVRSTPPHPPLRLINQLRLQTPNLGSGRPNQPCATLSDWSESYQTVQTDPDSCKGILNVPQDVTDLGLLIFQLSNKLSTSNIHDNKKLSEISVVLKAAALTSSGWKDLLIAGRGPTSMSLIEQLFNFSINVGDITVTEMMLQIGADPNQQVWISDLGMCVSALDFAVRSRSIGIINLLLNSGAAYSQRTLAYAIIAGDFDTADILLQSDPSLDLDFNYLYDSAAHMISKVGPLEFETVTLLGLVCLEHMCPRCFFCCNEQPHEFHLSEEYGSICRVSKCVDSLGYLLKHRAAINIDTMILASFTVDAVALQFLIQQGGIVCGVNRFGFSCLDGASLRDMLWYDLFHLLLHSGATINIPENHRTFGSHASPLHRLLLHPPPKHKLIDHRLLKIFELMVESGANINYHIRHLGSTSDLYEARERFLWSQLSLGLAPMDRVVQAKAESPLEYAIITGHENVALGLLYRGCLPTGREHKLAAKFGLLHLLKKLRKHGPWGANSDATCLRLALRWGHSRIVQFFLEDGVKIGEHDIIDALHCPGTSVLSTEIQIDVIRATPDLNDPKVFGLPLLELCCVKFSGAAVRETFERYPAAYNSGALCAIVFRALKYDLFGVDGFRLADIRAMLSRRTESNCDWDKENTALLVAAMFRRPEVVRILVTPDTVCMSKTARLPRDVFSRFVSQRYGENPFGQMEPTHLLGYQDWVTCSPLIGLVTTSDLWVYQSVSKNILDHLLACSYEPDALTVVVAATRCNLYLLRRFQCLANWQSIVSIDNYDRPPWCPTALQVAASDGNEELVNLLLDSGVSVNEKPAEQPLGKSMPRTALQASIDKGNPRLVDLFIEHGADINAPAAEDSGATALQIACIQGNVDVSLRLLELGADVNAKGALRRGRTALEGAAEYGRIDTIQLLLNYGVGTDGPHREQYIKAIVHAEWNDNFAAAALLKEHRAWTDEDEECYKSLEPYEWCDV